jgi:hypothetical protein
VVIDGTPYPQAEVLESLNYGCDPLFTKLSSVWSQRDDIRRSFADVWDSALIAGLARRLLGTYRAAYRVHDFEGMIRGVDANILFRTLKRFNEAYNANELIPRAYVLLEISEFVSYLRYTIQSGGKTTETLPREFEDRRKQLREKSLSNFEQKHYSNAL